MCKRRAQKRNLETGSNIHITIVHRIEERKQKTSPMKQLKKLLSRVKGVLITWKDIQKDHHHGGNRSTPTHITVK